MKIEFSDTPDLAEAPDELLNVTQLAHRFGISRARVIEKLAGLTPVSETVRGGKKFRVSEVEPLMQHQTYSKSDRKTQAQERLITQLSALAQHQSLKELAEGATLS